MDLKEQFEQSWRYFEQISEKLKTGRFLAEEDFSEILELLNRQKKVQDECRQNVVQMGLLSLEGEQELSVQRIEELIELEKARREKEQKIQQLQTLVKQFSSLQAASDIYAEDLAAVQKELSGQDEEQLWSLEQKGELQAYRDFLTCVQADDLQVGSLETLAGKFGYKLAFALLSRQLKFPDKDRQEYIPEMPVPEDCASEGCVPEELNVQEMPPEASVQPSCSDETEEQPPLTQPAEQTLPDEEEAFSPLVDASALDELVIRRKYKAPKGVKAFKSLAANPWEESSLMYIAEKAWSAPFTLVGLLRNIQSIRHSAVYRLLDRLVREGYLIRYSLSENPEKPIYAATPEGKAIFSKEALRKHYYNSRPATEQAVQIADAADFIRCYEALRVFDVISDEQIPYEVFCQQDSSGSFLKISAQKGKPVECLILPAIAYTLENAQNLEAWIENVREGASDIADHAMVFAAVYGDDFAGWEQFLRDKIGLPASARVYMGTVGMDLYRDSEGQEIHLLDYLKNNSFGQPEQAPLEQAEPMPAADLSAADMQPSAEQPEPEAQNEADILADEPVSEPADESASEPTVEPDREESAREEPAEEKQPQFVQGPADRQKEPEEQDKADEEPSVSDRTDDTQPEQAPEVAKPWEAEPELPAQEMDIEAFSVQQNAQLLLRNPEQISLRQLLNFAVQLLAKSRIAEALALLESIAESPQFGGQTRQFCRVLQQCVQQPGHKYQFSSDEINSQQSQLLPLENLPETEALHGLYQVMVLSNLLWSMVFPTVAYDHDLYNNAEMVLGDKLEHMLGDAFPTVRRLMDLLRTELKNLSFQYDGCGFSSTIINNLANTGERERSRAVLSHKAEELRRTPTSTVKITGLETCLKGMVGPSSAIGHALSILAENRAEEAGKLQQYLQDSLGLTQLDFTDSWLEEYIDSFWSNMRREDRSIRVRKLDNDSPAQRICKKALTDRLQVIKEWLAVSEINQKSDFGQYREQYARILNQLKRMLRELEETWSCSMPENCWMAAAQNLLRLAAERMENVLDKKQLEDSVLFYRDLWKTPELMIDSAGEAIILPELYDVSGLEPWVLCLYHAAAQQEEPQDILPQIADYKNERWYRNFGMEGLLYRLAGKPAPGVSEDYSAAEAAMQKEIQEFEGSIRMERAYGRLQEHTMETAFSVLHIARDVYLEIRNFASFHVFVCHLRQLLNRQISRQMQEYRQRVQDLRQQPEYEKSPWLAVIEKAMDGKSLNMVDTYINSMQSGEEELPNSVKTRGNDNNFLVEFQKCEDTYYRVCQQHSGDALANWGSGALEKMDKAFQHWTSSNERANSLPWLKNWVKRKNSPDSPERIKNILRGLGFQVQKVERMKGAPQIGKHECYRVEADRVSAGLKDYSHPIYKFGTELSIPMNVVCLYGCQGVSTLIRVMTNDLQLDGSTIVLMDGSLTAGDRRLLAQKFKTDTSGQSPFLLIDRVLALYLASVDRGDRQLAMLRCTLPYTFEVLYGSGSGAVPEEMFIGRMAELRELRSAQGPSLVYGGRQLGKTALLNRVSKTLHDPQNGAYSFCVEVKDHGSDTLLEKVNRKLIRLNLLRQECSSIEELCETLQDIWEKGQISYLRIFVDEVDSLFEEFSENDYVALRPFILLRDNTKHKVKFVFAGTHNVAATDIAESENNNLLHMGKPLCIKPLSNDDAMDLIQIPMSYLGFEIGKPQIELILSNTNNYPGLIHMFCNALIQAVCRDYSQFCDESETYPPYRISDAQMQTVFREQDIRKEIGQRVMATIRLNCKYKTVSYLLAQKIYEDQDKGCRQLYGYTARELKEYHQQEFGQGIISQISEKDLTTLMEEMENMGILWKKRETQQFRFRQQDFLEYIGDRDKVLETLYELMEEEKA